MTLDERSPFAAVVGVVGAALRRQGVRAVLTGGGCATLYTRGAYTSLDMDFIVVGRATRAVVDAALAAVGFTRRGDRYVHPRVRFYLEFPRGPLAIGGDHRIEPVERRTAAGRLLTLSATDACRDRLAAFYHWDDRQSLAVAVAIARRNRVNVSALRRWSAAEGHAARFREFLADVRIARRARRKRRRS